MHKDIRDILTAAASDGEYTLATVVAIEGSSYRRPGARMLVADTGRLAGSVSGGCLERDLARRGHWLASEGPRLMRFATDAEPDETELHYLGCGGVIELLIENTRGADPAGPLALLRWIRDQRAPAVLVTAIRGSKSIPVGSRVAQTGSGQALGHGGAALLSLCAGDIQDVLTRRASGRYRYPDGAEATDAEAGCEVFIEYLPPPRELLVAGRHHDVAPLVHMARFQGWTVTVAATGVPPTQLGRPDDTIELSADSVEGWVGDRPGAAVVVMTHSLALDRQLIAALLEQDALTYLGLLGPLHRTRDILEQVEREGGLPRQDAMARLHAPVGLDLGGDGPEAIALSIVAELQATWAKRSAQPLSRRTESGIHADSGGTPESLSHVAQ